MTDLPGWLTVKMPKRDVLASVQQRFGEFSLHTVCEEANCPNAGECFENKTATFLILGSKCTRNCSFCAVEPGKPNGIDPGEPQRVAQMAEALGLRYVVVTSVTRDDLSDGGAAIFAETIQALRKRISGVKVEVLIPDLQGCKESLARIGEALPDVISHNVETVPRLYPQVRPGAEYGRSLEILKWVKEIKPYIVTKAGIMVGLGESPEEVLQVMQDLRAAGVSILTIGQYLAPSEEHHPVVEYIPVEKFNYYRQKGLELEFDYIAAGPFVRSSFHAAKGFDMAVGRGQLRIDV